jgi:hypothetical protein
MWELQKGNQDRQFAYILTMKRVRVTTAAVEKIDINSLARELFFNISTPCM